MADKPAAVAATPAAPASTATAPPAATDDHVAAFSRAEKALQAEYDALTDATPDSASMRGTISTALAVLRTGRPGGP